VAPGPSRAPRGPEHSAPHLALPSEAGCLESQARVRIQALNTHREAHDCSACDADPTMPPELGNSADSEGGELAGELLLHADLDRRAVEGATTKNRVVVHRHVGELHDHQARIERRRGRERVDTRRADLETRACHIERLTGNRKDLPDSLDRQSETQGTRWRDPQLAFSHWLAGEWVNTEPTRHSAP